MSAYWRDKRGRGAVFTARYRSTCRYCGQPIEPGMSCVWGAMGYPKHETCPENASESRVDPSTDNGTGGGCSAARGPFPGRDGADTANDTAVSSGERDEEGEG